MYMIKYANLHQTVTGKRPEEETDQSHLTKFLTSINNVEISREICRRGIPYGTTLYYVWVSIPTQGESSLEHKKKGDSRTDVVANYL